MPRATRLRAHGALLRRDARPAYAILGRMRRYLVIDLEATCDDQGAVAREEMEIIEIGAALLDPSTWQVREEFDSFVRPVRNPRLTPFCTRLTTIIQTDVKKCAWPTPAISRG